MNSFLISLCFQLLEPFCLSINISERARAFDILNQLIQSSAMNNLREQVNLIEI